MGVPVAISIRSCDSYFAAVLESIALLLAAGWKRLPEQSRSRDLQMRHFAWNDGPYGIPGSGIRLASW